MREGLQEVREEPGRCSRIPERCRRIFTGVAGEQEVKEEPREMRRSPGRCGKRRRRCGRSPTGAQAAALSPAVSRW